MGNLSQFNLGGTTAPKPNTARPWEATDFNVSFATKVKGTPSAPIPTEMTLGAVINSIKGDQYKAKIDAIRSEPDTDKAKALKEDLPAIMFSGNFSEQKAGALIKHSGIICLDLDTKDFKEFTQADWEDTREKVIADKHVVFCFWSPRMGLKIGLRLANLSGDNHKSQGFPNAQIWACRYGLTLDKSGSDVGRRCFVSHDPDAYINLDATALNMIEIEEPERQAYDGRSVTGKTGEALRAGDDFNLRGDVQAVIAANGWTHYRGNHWTRPGKKSGVSGSFIGEDGRLFYCFTDGAAPLEPNESYPPFKLVTTLEHGSDFKAAAKALGADGYGEQLKDNAKKKAEGFKLDENAAALVQAGIVSEEWALDAFNFNAPNQRPEQKPQGRLLAILRAYEKLARLPQPELNLFSSIVTMGALVSDRITTANNDITSVYAMGLGATSRGKDVGISAPSKILNCFKSEAETILGELKSAQVLEALMSKNSRRLLLMDEVGHKIAAQRGDSFASQVAPLVTELWNGNDRRGSHALHRESFNCEKPRLSVYVTGSPDRVSDSLELEAISDGGLPRYLFATARTVNRRKDQKRPCDETEVLDQLKAEFSNYLERAAPTGKLFSDLIQTAKKVEILEDAQELAEEYGFQVADYADNLPSGYGAEFWHKGAQNVGRVALIHAAARASKPEEARVEVVDVTFAIEIVNYSIKGWVEFSDTIGGFPRAKALDAIEEFIKGHSNGATRLQINNKFYRKHGTELLNEYLTDLKEAGRISEKKEGSKGGAVYHA